MSQDKRGAVISFPRRRWIARLAVVVVVLALVIGVGGGRLYSYPRVDTLEHGQRVDAILALGGRAETAEYAKTLVEQGAAPVLIISDPYAPDEYLDIHAICSSRPTTYRVICFDPDPATTRGEAQELRRLAEQNGWTNLAVVAPVFHISRARTIVRRCWSGPLKMVEAPMPVSPTAWTYQYLRQTAGYVKVALQKGC